MRALFVAGLLLLGCVISVRAQDSSPGFRKTWSVEIGTGLRPLHMTLSPSRARERELMNQGYTADKKNAYYPVISLTGILRTARKTEFSFTAGVSWCHHSLILHEAFGTDPNGNPRYSMQDGTPAGHADSTPIFTITAQWRHIWTPDRQVHLYTGLGAGLLSSGGEILPLPAITPIGIRIGAQTHFHVFVECTMSPVASIVHGGLGWKF